MIETLKKIRGGQSLNQSEMELAIASILESHATPSQIGAFLMGLSLKGETTDEITAAAKVLRSKAAHIQSPNGTIDCCGTGGDHSNSLNISTATAFIVASNGVPVAKHGNRAASSSSGAADVLEALSVNIDIPLEACETALKDLGFCFLMAPRHHTILKPLAALRKELGFRTIFNLLGPLINPASTKIQLIGVYDRRFLVPIAEALRNLGATSACIVHGDDGLDEITLTGPTHIAELKNGEISTSILTPEDFGLPYCETDDFKGKDAAYNASELLELLKGKHSAYRNIVLANAAAALFLAEKSTNLKEAVELAANSLDTGRALELFEAYRNFTQNYK